MLYGTTNSCIHEDIYYALVLFRLSQNFPKETGKKHCHTVEFLLLLTNASFSIQAKEQEKTVAS